MAHIHTGEDRICIRRLAEGFRYIFAQLRHYRMINRLISEKIYLYLINLLIYAIRISICTDEFLKKALRETKKFLFPDFARLVYKSKFYSLSHNDYILRLISCIRKASYILRD